MSLIKTVQYIPVLQDADRTLTEQTRTGSDGRWFDGLFTPACECSSNHCSSKVSSNQRLCDVARTSRLLVMHEVCWLLSRTSKVINGRNKSPVSVHHLGIELLENQIARAKCTTRGKINHNFSGLLASFSLLDVTTAMADLTRRRKPTRYIHASVVGGCIGTIVPIPVKWTGWIYNIAHSFGMMPTFSFKTKY